MSASLLVRSPRQAVILATIVGLHVGVAVLVISGIDSRPAWMKPAPIDIFLRPMPPPKPPPVAPRVPGPLVFTPGLEPKPEIRIPDFKDNQPAPVDIHGSADQGAGAGPVVPVPEFRGPSVRTRDSRLAALIDACYPSASRRLAEEGRVVVQVRVDAAGRVVAWNVVERSGFPRLDNAAECVVRRLEFVPGRRDGAAVEATALLPIVFRLD